MFSSEDILCGLRIVCSPWDWSTVAYSAVLGILSTSIYDRQNDEKPRYHRQIAKIWRLYLLLPKHTAQRLCALHSFQCSHGCWKEAARELLHLNVAVTWINMCGFLHFCFFFFSVLLCVISRLSHSCVPSLNQIIWKALRLFFLFPALCNRYLYALLRLNVQTWGKAKNGWECLFAGI